MNFPALPDFHNGYCKSDLFYTCTYPTSRIAMQLRVQMDIIRAGKDLAIYPGYSSTCRTYPTAIAICLPTPDINLSLGCTLYWSSPNTLRSDNTSMGNTSLRVNTFSGTLWTTKSEGDTVASQSFSTNSTHKHNSLSLFAFSFCGSKPQGSHLKESHVKNDTLGEL